MQRIHRSVRGGLSPAMMFLIAALVVLAGVGLWFMTNVRQEHKELEHRGEVGAVATTKLAREAGVNLPFASQAVADTPSPDTVIEIPLEWGNDVAAVRPKLAAQYDAIEKKLTKNGDSYDETITLKIDRDLECRMLYLAVLEGAATRGFTKFQLACHPTGESREVRYLRIEAPRERLGTLLLRIFRDGERWRYVLGVTKTEELPSLVKAAARMKELPKLDKNGNPRAFSLQAALDLSVEHAVEALNAAAYGGFEKIALDNMLKLD
jgi:biopolymer transport protein ExbD